MLGLFALLRQNRFNNVANFNRRFLEIKGMTPKEFRRQGEARFGVVR